MTDTLWQNGSTALDQRGCHIMLSHSEALMQRAKLRLTARLGSFIYDRSLGSRIGESAPGAGEEERILLANEALTGLENTFAAPGGESGLIRIDVDGETEDMEVCRYGNV